MKNIQIDEENTVYETRGLNALVEIETNTILQGCNNSLIDNSIEHIANEAFNGCENLQGPIDLSNIKSGSILGILALL